MATESFDEQPLISSCDISASGSQPGAEIDENLEFLTRKCGIDWHYLTGPCAELLEGPGRDRTGAFVRSSHAQYLMALILVYAIYKLIVDSGREDEAFAWLRLRLDVKQHKRTDLIELLLRWLIEYGDNNDPRYRQYWCRDRAALRYLIEQKVMPWQVLDYQKEYGGGVDAWARLQRHTSHPASPDQANGRSKKAPEETPLDLPPAFAAGEEDGGAHEITSVTSHKSEGGELILTFTAVDADLPPLRLTPRVARDLQALLESSGYVRELPNTHGGSRVPATRTTRGQV